MRTLAMLLVVPIALAGCGGGGKSSTGGGRSVAKCLNDAKFLVQGRGARVDGTSPRGVSFSLVRYRTRPAATAAARRKRARTTAVVGTAVVDFSGNPPPSSGAAPARLSQAELATIRSCLD